MKLSEWFRPPRAVLTLFISLMVVCAAALAWLSRQVFVQDRVVAAQQRQAQLETAADRAVAAIEQRFAAPDVEVTIAASGEAEIHPAGSLAFVPSQPAPAPPRTEIFAAAETLEFVKQDLPGA